VWHGTAHAAPQQRRLALLNDWLEGPDSEEAWLALQACAAEELPESESPELVPFGFESALLRSRWARSHLQWMQRKEQLQQDMFLLGVHGPLRRWLALVFCEKMGREVRRDCT
jgi:hypothetical protein